MKEKNIVPCPCGADAVWYRAQTSPERVPEEAVCFLTDADFTDNYCEDCFPQAVPPSNRPQWKRIDDFIR